MDTPTEQPTPLSLPSPIAPETILCDRYRIVGLAGQGTFGHTYLAQDQQRFNDLCVLKEFIPPSIRPEVLETLRQQFHQAAAPLYKLEHPQIPRLRGLLIQDQRYYLARSYVPGKSYRALLEEYRNQGQSFSQVDVLELLLAILPVLAYLHQMGVVHQALTLEHLILRQPDQVPVLINFGLINQLVAQHCLHRGALSVTSDNTPYLPSEIGKTGEFSPAIDLYSLGIAAIALLTGKYPEELFNGKNQRPTWEESVAVHPDLVDILRRLVHPQPRQRFTSALQVMRALQPIAQSQLPPSQTDRAQLRPTSAASPQLRRHQRPKPTRKRWFRQDALPSLLLGGSLAILLGTIAWRMLGAGRSPSMSSPNLPVIEASPLAPLPDTLPPTATTNPAPKLVVPTPSSIAVGQAQAPTPQQISDRRQRSGVQSQLFNDLVDEVFYGRYPQMVGRKLGDEASQRSLREEWLTIATELLTQLETFSPAQRRKLGTYRQGDLDKQLLALQNQKEKLAKIDNQFQRLFPGQTGRSANLKTFGQIWCAIAETSLK